MYVDRSLCGLSLLPKNCFVNRKTQTRRSTSNTSSSKFNAIIPQWSEASSNEEEYIWMRKWKKEINVEIINDGGKEKETKIRKCSRKVHVDIINE